MLEGTRNVQVYSSWATAQEVHTGRTAAEASNLQAQFLAQFLNTVVVGVCSIATTLLTCWAHGTIVAPLTTNTPMSCYFLLLP